MRTFALTLLAATGALVLLAAASAPRAALRVPQVSRFAAAGDLDCNGYSPIQRPLKPIMACADLSIEDNGHYVGHDEPEVQFYSSAPKSGYDLQWSIKLPVDPPLPATHTFENEVAFWFGLAICDPKSYPGNPCKPDSDANVGGANNPKAAGSAYLEMQFYPPGLPDQPVSSSCDGKHWCAAMGVFSLECTAKGICNRNCEEPYNFAFIQLDGMPTGPPGPLDATLATFTPNARTLLMGQGDELHVTIKDSPKGLLNEIQDLTTGKTGFMIASAANGFQHLDSATCAGSPFTFRPEFATARETNGLSWSLGIRNVAYAAEIGHFEPRDGDGDEKPCFKGPLIPGCEGADVDFDGMSYRTDWPDGTSAHAASIEIGSTPGDGAGPASLDDGRYRAGYPEMRFVTGVPASEPGCEGNGTGCSVPPPGAAFYPFYALSENGGNCFLTLGNGIQGSTTEDFGGEKQWGSYDAKVQGTFQGHVLRNPCVPH